MFAQSRKTSEKVPELYVELRDRLDNLFRANDLNPEEIRRKVAAEAVKQEAGKVTAGSKFAARSVAKQSTKYTGKYATGKSATVKDSETKKLSLRNDNLLSEVCDWADESFSADVTPEKILSWDVTEIEDRMSSRIEDRFNGEMRGMERSLVLQILDTIWKDHLLVMDHLRSSIGLRGYAQVDPKVEFKREGMRIFGEMWSTIYSRVTDLIFRMEQLEPEAITSTWKETSATHAESGSTMSDFAREQSATADSSGGDKKQEPFRNMQPQVGRNEPCPCGSGKKYKNCCLKK
jgi:preprotein translocase subunit SecA